MKIPSYCIFCIILHTLTLINPTTAYPLSTPFVDNTYSVDSDAVTPEINNHSPAYIAGITIACVGSLLLFLLICLCAWRRRRGMQDSRGLRHPSRRDILEEGKNGTESVHGVSQTPGGPTVIVTAPSPAENRIPFPPPSQPHERTVSSARVGSRLLPSIAEHSSPHAFKQEKSLPQIPPEPTRLGETVLATQEGFDAGDSNDRIAAIDQDSEFETPVEAEVVPETEEQYKTVLVQCVESNHLNTFFPPEDPFIQKISAIAANLRANNDPLLQTVENVDRLTCLTLYQLVIYCDDSGSMAGGRHNTQQQLVSRIVSIATKILPDEYGVELRFINSGFADNVRTSQVEAAVASVRPVGSTPIGTNLRRKILEPLVYNILSASDEKLQRPFLICSITDGCPTTEPESKFKDEIVECRQRLTGANYHPKSVMFCISQIGDDPLAFAFLHRLRVDSEIQDVLYCTSDQLDEKFKEFKDNERALDEWLLKTLTTPLMSRKDN